MTERRKERKYPKLVWRRARSRLVVLVVSAAFPSALLPTLVSRSEGGSCVDVRSRLGVCVGVPCCLAQQPKDTSLSSQDLLEPTETLPPHTRSSETSCLRGGSDMLSVALRTKALRQTFALFPQTKKFGCGLHTTAREPKNVYI